jgi:uracil-DNA glycosylase family 4
MRGRPTARLDPRTADAFMTTDPARDLHALLSWWRDAGVVSAEAEAILVAPSPNTAPNAVSGGSARPRGRGGQAPAQASPGAPAPIRPVAKAPAKAAEPRARTIAEAASTLEALQEAIHSYDDCSLKQTAQSTVVFDGVKTAKVLVIGEAPSREEDAAGKPFAGPAGQLMDRMFAEIGLSRRSNLLMTNTLYWRPPGNRNPDAAELAHCLPFVERTIALLQPRAVLLVGGMAANALLPVRDGILKLRGRTFTMENIGLTKPVNAMVMLHPAYLLRRPLDKRLAWADLLAAEAWLDGLGVQRERQP